MARRSPDDLEPLADRLAAWIGDRRPALIGHSMGGVLATLIAERIAVRAVVDVDGQPVARRLHVQRPGRGVLARRLRRATATRRCAPTSTSAAAAISALRGYHAAMCAASPRVFHHHALELIAMSEPRDPRDPARRAPRPVLFVAGVPDGICAHSRGLLDRHGIRWVGLEPAGHWVHFDQPDAFASAVAGFLHEL